MQPTTTPITSNLYKPAYGLSMDKITTMPQIRLGIQGSPKTGKSYSSTSYPNPVFINLDRGLGAHIGNPNIIEIALYDKLVRDKIKPNSLIKECLEHFMEQEAPKFTKEQTLVLDGSTGLQNAFNKWSELNPQYTKFGKIDEYAHWRLKLDFFGALMEQFKHLKCNVIYIAHETAAKDKDGTYTGKVKPLLNGSFGDELASHFTDWVKQNSTSKPKPSTVLNAEQLKANWRMTEPEFRAMADEFKDTDSIYYWQTFSDDTVDCGSSSLINPPRFIPATYSYFTKYMRKLATI